MACFWFSLSLRGALKGVRVASANHWLVYFVRCRKVVQVLGFLTFVFLGLCLCLWLRLRLGLDLGLGLVLTLLTIHRGPRILIRFVLYLLVPLINFILQRDGSTSNISFKLLCKKIILLALISRVARPFSKRTAPCRLLHDRCASNFGVQRFRWRIRIRIWA